MSALDELKQRVSALAEDAERTSGELASFETEFSDASQKVAAEIGNTATGEDQEIIASLQAASQALEQSVAALQQASQSCNDFAQSL